jgi:hypothetical protein
VLTYLGALSVSSRVLLLRMELFPVLGEPFFELFLELFLDPFNEPFCISKLRSVRSSRLRSSSVPFKIVRGMFFFGTRWAPA